MKMPTRYCHKFPILILEIVISIIMTIFVFLILTPIVIVFLLPFYVWRLIVLCFVNFCTNGKIHSVFHPLDLMFIMDKFYSKPNCGIPTILFIKGEPNIEKIQKEFVDKIILCPRNKQNSELKYEKLQQYPVKYFGYYFWKWDEEFSIKNHIKLVENVKLNDSNLCEFIATCTQFPFQSKTSLWNILIVPEYNGIPDSYLMILRFHHTIADGFSLCKLILLGIMGLPELPKSIPKPTKIKQHFCKTVLIKCKFFFGLPLIYLKEILKLNDQNPFHNPKEVQLTGEWVAALSPHLKLQDFKDAKNRLKTPFTAILTAGLAGGMQNYLSKFTTEHNIPKTMHFYYPAPIPGHPNDKLTNHFTTCTGSISMGIPNIEQRLQKSKKDFLHLVASPFGMVNYFLFNILGTLPAVLAELATSFQGGTFVLSNFPGAQEEAQIFGDPVEDCAFFLPLMRNITGINFSVLSYNGRIRIGIMADKAYVPNKEHIEKLVHEIYVELCCILHYKIKGYNNSLKPIMSV